MSNEKNGAMQYYTNLYFVYKNYYMILNYKCVEYTIKPAYTDHSREPEDVSFMNRCPLYTG